MRKCLLSLALIGTVATVSAQAPDSVSFQGRLTDVSGIPIDTPSVSMTFRLYRGGTAVWTETHPNVTIADGGFHRAVQSDEAIRRGVCIVRGQITYPGVAEAFGLPCVPLDSVLESPWAE